MNFSTPILNTSSLSVVGNTATKILGFDLDKLWWGLCSGLMKIIDWLTLTFDFLTGAEVIDPSGNGGTGGNVNDLLSSVFKGVGDGVSMTDMYMWFLVLCGGLLLLFVGIGAIKSQFSKDPTESLANIGVKSLFALIKMICIPVVFFIALQSVTYILQFVTNVMSSGMETTSIAQLLCDACYLPDLHGDYPQLHFNAPYTIKGSALADSMAGENTYVAAVGNGGQFNFLMCFLAGATLLVTLVTVALSLTKRIIEVFFYYLTAPVAICRTPLDDGKSFELWKENVISKLFSAAGTIICLYLYLRLIPMIQAVVAQWIVSVTTHGGLGKGVDAVIVGAVINLLFLIGGSMVVASAPAMMAQILSQGAGQNESASMMHTQQMLGTAAHIATGAATRLIMGSARGGSGGGSKSSGSGSSGGGSGGGFSSFMSGVGSGGGIDFGGSGGGSSSRAGSTARSFFANNGGSNAAGAGGAFTPEAVGDATFETTLSFGNNLVNNLKGGGMSDSSKVEAAATALGGAPGKAAATVATGVTKIGKEVGKKIANASMEGAQRGLRKAAGNGSSLRGGKGRTRMAQGELERQRGEKTKFDTQYSEGKTAGETFVKALEAQKSENVSAHIISKIDNYEARAAKIEEFLNKQTGWDDNKKQAYRRNQLENEANRISVHADNSYRSMNDNSIQRFTSFYDKMKKDLYGEDTEKGGDEQ